ncbi:4'-phosphopantetheinyl transferase family protein [Litchfieldella rifensis]|uniref:4'-phosphopantetheinyl transferase family protein n=1 Tax=Litchfieldella rifensis TaxID=762643 RepID=A0ABV7LRX3_9GAMM
MTARLDLLLAQAPAGSSGACLSRLGRELLSRLAARHGLDCPLADWSPRGRGAPQHPALPSPWQACLSHRGQRVVAGLATIPVGIDLEHARARHASRLASLVDLLPEPEVRRTIHAAARPQAAFYRAWTLHEALYKLASLNGERPTGVFATRLARLVPHGDAHAWLWQTDDWTLTIAAYVPTLTIHILPDISLTKHEWA